MIEKNQKRLNLYRLSLTVEHILTGLQYGNILQERYSKEWTT